MGEPERARSASGDIEHVGLLLERQARWRYIERLLEERAGEVIGFIEDGERRELPAGHDRFDRDLPARHVILHEELEEPGISPRVARVALEDGPHPVHRAEEL